VVFPLTAGETGISSDVLALKRALRGGHFSRVAEDRTGDCRASRSSNQRLDSCAAPRSEEAWACGSPAGVHCVGLGLMVTEAQLERST
jgi:hypothetical protein